MAAWTSWAARPLGMWVLCAPYILHMEIEDQTSEGLSSGEKTEKWYLSSQSWYVQSRWNLSEWIFVYAILKYDQVRSLESCLWGEVCERFRYIYNPDSGELSLNLGPIIFGSSLLFQFFSVLTKSLSQIVPYLPHQSLELPHPRDSCRI